MKQIAESYYWPRIKVEFISCIHDINQKKFFGSTRQEQNWLPIITQFNCNDKAAIFSESYYLSEEYKGEYEVWIGCDIF
jgi:hypothetical protein